MKEIPFILTPWGGAGTVTGSNFMVRTGGKTLLIDCGMEQGGKEVIKNNYEPFGYEPRKVDTLIVTHAHYDHVGRIPKLIKDGFTGPIFSTPQTKALAQLVLEDAVGLIAQEAKEQGFKKPLFDEADVKRAFDNWQTIEYHDVHDIAEGVTMRLLDAGHVLGSSMVELTHTATGRVLMLTGDLGNSPSPLLRDTETITGVNYLVMESVYGDRNHEPKEVRSTMLKDIISRTIARGGTVVIPAFSLERTQVILYELNDLIEGKHIPSVPVFVDSPLAIHMTEIYERNSKVFNEHAQAQIAQGDDIFNFPKLSFTVRREESDEIERQPGPKIILAGSGMSMGGRVRHHEARYAADAKNSIVLVGYQPLGTFGRTLLSGVKAVTIDGMQVPLKAEITAIFGYSAHKDSDHLVKFVAPTAGTLKKVFVAMGEPKAAMFLAQRLNAELGLEAVVPEEGEEYRLE
jgi:metallo-beta-lactamase family protein